MTSLKCVYPDKLSTEIVIVTNMPCIIQMLKLAVLLQKSLIGIQLTHLFMLIIKVVVSNFIKLELRDNRVAYFKPIFDSETSLDAFLVNVDIMVVVYPFETVVCPSNSSLFEVKSILFKSSFLNYFNLHLCF